MYEVIRCIATKIIKCLEIFYRAAVTMHFTSVMLQSLIGSTF